MPFLSPRNQRANRVFRVRFVQIPTLVLVACVALVGCHVTRRSTESVESSRSLRPLLDTAKPHGEAVVVTPDGRLRFVEPLVCKAEVVVEGEKFEVVSEQENLATVVVGIIAASIGGVALFAGLASDDGDATAAAGALGLAIGGPMTLAPFFGRSKSRRSIGKTRYVKGTRDGQPCGDKPIAADRAILEIANQRVYGTVDANGEFSVPVFEFLDAFAPPHVQALRLKVVIPHEIVPRKLESTLDAETLAAGRDGFFRAAGVDAETPPLQKVPSISFDNPTATHGDDGVTLGLTIKNDGPGAAYGVRARTQSRYPYLDGRILYVGRLDRGATATPSLTVRIPDTAVPASTVVTIYVDDADKTAPSYSLTTRVTRPLKGMDSR